MPREAGVLPPGFLWGTSTSAHQVEGGSHNDWTAFEPRVPAAGAACDFARRYEEDLDRARALGTNAFRFSVEWSRVEPEPGRRDPRAVAAYERLVDACLARGLAPVLTLLHFTLPAWCRGGWLDPSTQEAFARHARFVAEVFAGRVRTFVTVNEPNVLAGAGYVAGVFPPGRRFRPGEADRCLAALLAAHAAAYRALHDVAARRGAPLAAGPALQLVAWGPGRLDPFGLARRAAERFNWAFLDALATGELDLATRRVATPHARGTADFAGVNYFLGLPADLPSLLRFAGLLRREARPGTSDMGWPIDAAGFERVLRDAHRRTGLPLLVTENGVADARDALRPRYLVEHVAALERAVAGGADVRGYLHWSLLDNYEWHEGYGPRFGLFAVDYDTQARAERRSCEVYRRLIAERTSTEDAGHLRAANGALSAPPR